MNKNTPQLLIDEIVKDTEGILKDEHPEQIYIWWRGRLSGVIEAINVIDIEAVDISKAEDLLEELYKAEEMAQ